MVTSFPLSASSLLLMVDNYSSVPCSAQLATSFRCIFFKLSKLNNDGKHIIYSPRFVCKVCLNIMDLINHIYTLKLRPECLNSCSRSEPRFSQIRRTSTKHETSIFGCDTEFSGLFNDAVFCHVTQKTNYFFSN
jgi:hypothetical protein